jgi:hypothetical protein
MKTRTGIQGFVSSGSSSVDGDLVSWIIDRVSDMEDVV